MRLLKALIQASATGVRNDEYTPNRRPIGADITEVREIEEIDIGEKECETRESRQLVVMWQNRKDKW
jgi:hypothetical protein